MRKANGEHQKIQNRRTFNQWHIECIPVEAHNDNFNDVEIIDLYLLLKSRSSIIFLQQFYWLDDRFTIEREIFVVVV